MLYQHPRQRRTNLRAQQSSPFDFVQTELSAGPQGNVHLAVVLVLQYSQRYRPGVRVLDVQGQEVFERGDVSFRAAGEFGVFQEQDIGVLSERHQLAFDVVGCCFMARGKDVVWDHETGGDVDGLIVDTF